MSWLRLFELFIIISLIVCAIKIESEKVKVEKGKEKVEKEKDEKDLLNSIDYSKDILGFKQDEQDQKDIDQLQK